MKLKNLTIIFTSMILQGIFNPLHSDTIKDIQDLKQLIKSTGTKIIESTNCQENELGHYTYKDKTDELIICTNNIDKNDISSYWEVLAHESAHIMQACNNNNLYKDKYHPRMIRKLKTDAPHYSEILKQYRGQDKIRELEAFDMELKSPQMVKEDFEFYCISDRSNSEVMDLSDQQVENLKGLVGGEENYNYKGALADLNKVIKIDPTYTAAFNYRGNTKIFLKDYSGAISDFSTVLSQDPLFLNARSNRGIGHYFAGNYYLAINDLRRSLKLDKKDKKGKAGSNYYIGLSMEKLGDIEGACSSWRKASSLVDKETQENFDLPKLIERNCQ